LELVLLQSSEVEDEISHPRVWFFR